MSHQTNLQTVKATILIMTFIVILNCCHYHSNSQFLKILPIVEAFTILESGQRIPPIYKKRFQHDKDKDDNIDSDEVIVKTVTMKNDKIPIAMKVKEENQYGTRNDKSMLNEKSTSKAGLLDLPAIEKWAQINKISEHHIKTLYRILLRHCDSSSSSSTSSTSSTPFTPNENKIKKDNLNMIPNEMSPPKPLVALLLYKELVDADFPRNAASSLLFHPDINDNENQYRTGKEFTPLTSKIVRIQPSQSGGFKLVIQLQSGELIETVIIRHDRSSTLTNKSTLTTPSRYTVCVSSQVGCARACTFCATGTMGLLGQLSSTEILEQVFHAKRFLSSLSQPLDKEVTNESSPNNQKEKKRRRRVQSMHDIRNVVFMGMGEPMDNYSSVIEACRGLTHQCLFGLKARQVTISTVGATPERIRWLAEDAPSISLALSLHGATQKIREELIPSARRISQRHKHQQQQQQQQPLKNLDYLQEYDKGHMDSLQVLGDALDYHAKCTGRGAMIEYLLIDGVNDSDDAADALGAFCFDRQKNLEVSLNQSSSSSPRNKKRSSFVNLIPYNPTIAGDIFDYETPSDDRIDSFCLKLREKYDIKALVRWSSAGGRDADGACGQLALTTTAPII